MKKVIYISAVVLGLGFVSCQKQEIHPASQEMEAPTWQEASDSDENARSINNNGINLRSGGAEDTGVPIDTNGNGTISEDTDITDPNLDPDAG